jgi:hypothetical protein
MPRAFKRGLLVTLIGVGAFGAGCGRSAGSADGDVLASAGSTTPQASASASSTPRASGQLVAGQVTLTLDKQRYATNDTIVVTIHNGLSQPIWTADHQTNCTIVTAERLQVGQWVAVAHCQLMTPTRMVMLPAGSSTPRQLSGAQGTVPPESQAPVPTESWTPGTYRVTFTYAGSADGTGRPGGVIHSVEFTMG